MIRIKVPATSANLAVGFDSLGIALNLYNVFVFKPSKTTSFNGFEQSDQTLDNLVYQAYHAFASQSGDVQPVTITLEQSNIPKSRGLGSSASCILAGVFAANIIHDLRKSTEECVAFAADFEGHPDNIFAAMYGSLTAVMKDNDGYICQTFPVAKTLQFYLLIPSTKGETSSLRKVLPKSVPMEAAIFHLSRMIHVPNAFVSGDILHLKRVLQDQIHETYRYPSIPQYKTVQFLKRQLNAVVAISGSGPTVLVISTDDVREQLSQFDSFTIVQVFPTGGMTIEGQS